MNLFDDVILTGEITEPIPGDVGFSGWDGL
jgi:hypothetical protein